MFLMPGSMNPCATTRTTRSAKSVTRSISTDTSTNISRRDRSLRSSLTSRLSSRTSSSCYRKSRVETLGIATLQFAERLGGLGSPPQSSNYIYIFYLFLYIYWGICLKNIYMERNIYVFNTFLYI